jgi:hypothetical protein
MVECLTLYHMDCIAICPTIASWEENAGSWFWRISLLNLAEGWLGIIGLWSNIALQGHVEDQA